MVFMVQYRYLGLWDLSFFLGGGVFGLGWIVDGIFWLWVSRVWCGIPVGCDVYCIGLDKVPCLWFI